MMLISFYQFTVDSKGPYILGDEISENSYIRDPDFITQHYKNAILLKKIKFLIKL